MTKKLKSRLCNWNSGGAMSGGGKKREIFRIVWERFRKILEIWKGFQIGFLKMLG